MLTHRNPQASVSKPAPSDNSHTIDATLEPLLISPHLRLVEIAPGANEPPLLASSCRSTRPHRMSRIARMERAR